MKQATREWIKKAESDFQLASSLARRRKILVCEQTCFFCQQSEEKYLKACREEGGIRFPKTHDLEDLVHLLLPLEPLWSALMPAAQHLTAFAVRFRYPGYDATPKDVKKALAHAKTIRTEARLSFGL
jgi:HEPN domain-containing protein